MKKLKKGRTFVDSEDQIKRTIIDIEESDEDDYVCYYIDIPFNDGDEFFEHGSLYHEQLLTPTELRE